MDFETGKKDVGVVTKENEFIQIMCFYEEEVCFFISSFFSLYILLAIFFITKKNVRIEAVVSSTKMFLPRSLIIFKCVPYDTFIAAITAATIVTACTGDFATVCCQNFNVDTIGKAEHVIDVIHEAVVVQGDDSKVR